ncbi:MAG: hypothetical protein CMG00_06815 [Candidatus Marinimicrobia bacterium]|nr:hypothetical protein [Candidatus Neomarinimicrobiota bacterium]|tara:strand:+ start:2035 stop:2742 length:708 start_codon:yes stop_codon:yes gene_type:complete
MHKKIILVTGASSGIGKQLSIELSKRNFEVILASRNLSGLQDTAKKINALGGKSHIISVDVTCPDSIKKLYKKSLKIGFVETVVNNAGLGIFDKIQDISIEDWDSQISTNLRASFLITKFFSKPMIDRSQGMIVFINSVAGKKAYPGSSAYVSSKFGLLGFSRSIREEFREHNIKVISVQPGAVDTGFWDKIGFDFPRQEMMSGADVAKSIVDAMLPSSKLVVEEIDIQRVQGDF